MSFLCLLKTKEDILKNVDSQWSPMTSIVFFIWRTSTVWLNIFFKISSFMFNRSNKIKLSNQIKSNHFYCHITTAQVPWWVKFLWACSRQCKKTTDNLPMDRQCKKTTNNLPMDRQCKKTTNNLHMDRQCKKTTAIYIWTDSAKKTTAIYIWTDSAKNNSSLHMDSTYLQTVQKTMCKIHIHILSTLSVL